MFKQNVSNAITFLRLVILPFLAYSFFHQFTYGSYALFLFSIGTDFADGYVARKLGLESKLGTYLDVSVDFLFISGMYLVFIIKGIYSPWILFLVFFVFAQFLVSNLFMKVTFYDPIGKYYGSLLFGGIGLTLLFSNQLIYDVVTFGIVVSTLISLISRLIFFLVKFYNKKTI